jgi:hypothetical protein
MNTKPTKSIYYQAIIVVIFAISIASCTQKKVNTYQGTPYQDSVYTGGPQTIPGKLQCEYYDMGGEGITFHDTDSINSGSGRLNPADGSYLHEFRINEPVDISFTKFRDPAIDNSPYNFVEPTVNQLYLGWTLPGEWTKYTVDVKEPGTYKLGIMYTSNQDGMIALAVNDVMATDSLLIPNTFVEADTISWRQWHHWNYIDSLSTIDLEKGQQVITLHTVKIGQMNYDFINFELVKR